MEKFEEATEELEHFIDEEYFAKSLAGLAGARVAGISREQVGVRDCILRHAEDVIDEKAGAFGENFDHTLRKIWILSADGLVYTLTQMQPKADALVQTTTKRKTFHIQF